MVNISDDYDEGLDKEIQCKLYNIFKKEYNLENIDDITIGILGFVRDTHDYFSEKEANIFDLLYCDWNIQETEIYIKGKLIKNENK